MRSSRVAWATEHIQDQSRQQGKTQTSNQKKEKGARWVISELQTENVQSERLWSIHVEEREERL